MLQAQNFKVVFVIDRGSSRLFLIKIIFKLRELGDCVILFFFFFILQNTVLILCNANDTKKKRKKMFNNQHRIRINLRRCGWVYELVLYSSYTHPAKTISFLIEWRSNIHRGCGCVKGVSVGTQPALTPLNLSRLHSFEYDS
jgi:hypothetical protein